MAKKLYDLTVKVGSYQAQDGKTRGRYTNVGVMLEKDDGGKFLMIDPCFNFAGIKREDGRDMVIVSMFEPKAKETSGFLSESPKEVQWSE